MSSEYPLEKQVSFLTVELENIHTGLLAFSTWRESERCKNLRQ